MARALGLMAAILGAGCAFMSPETVTPANEVTLPAAMKSIACGLKTYQNELSRLRMNTGSIQDTVEVILNLKASSTAKDELVVDAKPSFGGVTPVGVSNTASLENAGARENTVRILFKNIYTAALNDPGKTQVKKRPVPLGAGPATYAWVDDPCRSVTDPVSIEYLRQLYLRGEHG